MALLDGTMTLSFSEQVARAAAESAQSIAHWEFRLALFQDVAVPNYFESLKEGWILGRIFVVHMPS